jgi:hypothetical protein
MAAVVDVVEAVNSGADRRPQVAVQRRRPTAAAAHWAGRIYAKERRRPHFVATP